MAERPIRFTTEDLSPQTVEIDGGLYDLSRPGALSVLESRRFTRAVLRMADIEKMEEPSALDETEYEDLLKRACAIVLSAPEELIRNSLTSIQRLEILNAFRLGSQKTERAGRAAGRKTREKTTRRKKTGAKRSQG